MKAFQTFYFTGYDFDPKTLKASFFYSFDHEVDFTETIDLACPGFQPINPIDPEIITTLLFHLSLAVGVSYYKLHPTKNLVIESGSLDGDQQQFRKTFYTQGLGEFFFRNALSPKGLINFVNGTTETPQKFFPSISQKPMIAIGGGKDSLVSIELIKKLNIPFYTSTFGKNYYLHKVVGDAIGAPRLVMERKIDPKLFEMNQQGYYNGHVPISGIIAFVLTTAAYLYDYRYIIMSNEKSANEGNTVMDGIEINHQRSKSYQFESDFSKYIKKYLSPDLEYFSLLRGMYELKIAKLFSQYPRYFGIFSSCNNNFKLIESNRTTTNRWCGVCPKCAFVYATLRPFLSDEDTQRIFGQELYENAGLTTMYKELLGIDGIKPFECVGTNEEVTYAMYLYYEKIMLKHNENQKISEDFHDVENIPSILDTSSSNEVKKLKISKTDRGKNDSQIPPIMELFKNEVLPTLSTDDLVNLEKKLFTLYTKETHIPKLFQAILPE